jgi:hypothetical protein
MELPINIVGMLVVLLALVAVLLVLLSCGGSNFTDPGGDKIRSAEHFTRSGIPYAEFHNPGHMPEFISDMGLAVASIDRAHEPEGVSIMEWGTRTAIDTYRKLHNRVPDMVYDLGAVGKEPIVRLLAHRAVDAAGMGVEIGRRLREE